MCNPMINFINLIAFLSPTVLVEKHLEEGGNFSYVKKVQFFFTLWSEQGFLSKTSIPKYLA